MYTEKSIQKLINTEFCGKRNHIMSIPNIYLYAWESDIITINRNQRITEYEIKISKWDYLADVKKVEKHEALSNGSNYDMIPNYFYYVVPEDIARNIDVAEYAGLISICKRGMNNYLKVVKKAPTLHPNPMREETWKEIAIKLYYKLY